MRRHLWPGSVRVRAAMVATVTVAVSLLVAALGLIALLRASLEDGVKSSAQLQASTIVSLVHRGEIPNVLPVGQGDLAAEVVTKTGVVLGTTPGVVAPVPLIQFPKTALYGSGSNPLIETLPVLPIGEAEIGGSERDDGGDGPFVVVIYLVTIGSHQEGAKATVNGERHFPEASNHIHGAVAVEVAASLKGSWQVVADVERALLFGIPVLVAIVALIVLWLTGRALSPVEAMRDEVADITLTDLHRRVPLPRTNDEVGRLANTMNAMLDRLEASVSKQRRFVADASHELRTPIATIEANLEVALAHPETISWNEAAAVALAGTRRLERIVDELLLLARSDDDSLIAANWRPVDLDEIVLAEAAFSAPPPNIWLDLSRLSAGRVRGDGEALRRMVRNLLDNAYQHGVSVVSVEVRSENDMVELVVADDGPGIPPEAREIVFRRFARLDDARGRERGGAGLGLALVKEIVEGHGATIEIVNNDPGAKFIVSFPVPTD